MVIPLQRLVSSIDSFLYGSTKILAATVTAVPGCRYLEASLIALDGYPISHQGQIGNLLTALFQSANLTRFRHMMPLNPTSDNNIPQMPLARLGFAKARCYC